eukprot:5379231-Pleurochrysis_carterae.AAC.1
MLVDDVVELHLADEVLARVVLARLRRVLAGDRHLLVHDLRVFVEHVVQPLDHHTPVAWR